MSVKTLRRIRKWLLGLLLLSAGIALTVKYFPREKDLREHATRVADVRAWWTEVTGSNDEPYIWLSDHVLMAHRGFPRLDAPFTFNIRTGEKAPLDKLYTRLSQGQEFMAYRWKMSPDRQWLLWIVGPEMNIIYASKLDGSQYQECRMPGGNVSEIGWEEDSRHWMALYHDQKKGGMGVSIRGDINAPGRPRLIPDATGWWYYSPVVEYVGVPRPRGTYVSKRWPKNRLIEVVPPPGTKIFDCATDEIGEKVAWVYVVSRPSAFAAWIKRLLPNYSTPTKPVAELWTSRTDGTAMRSLGVLPFDETPRKGLEAEAFGLDRPQFVRWLPDGKRLSFVYKGGLYIIPVD